MHIIVASTIVSMNIFVSAVPDLKAIFGPSFFNRKAIVRYNIGWAAMLCAILKTKSPENTTVAPTTPRGNDTEHLQSHDSKKKIKIRQTALSSLAE